MYVCMCVCMYVCIHVCMYVYMYVCIRMYVYLYVCMYVYIHARMRQDEIEGDGKRGKSRKSSWRGGRVANRVCE